MPALLMYGSSGYGDACFLNMQSLRVIETMLGTYNCSNYLVTSIWPIADVSHDVSVDDDVSCMLVTDRE